MSLEYPDAARKILNALGFNVKTSELYMRGRLSMALSLYLCGQTIVSMGKHWEEVTHRSQAMEHFLISFTVTLMLIQYAFLPNSVQGLLETAEEKYFQYKGVASDEEKSLKKKTTDDINFGARVVAKLLMLEFAALILTPLAYIAYLGIFRSEFKNTTFQTIRYQDLPLPLAYGQECTTFSTYVFIYAIQIVYMYGCIKLGYCFYNSVTFPIRRITSEAMLFSIALKSIDRTIDLDKDRNIYKHSAVDLKQTFHQVVLHHDIIYKKCKNLNKNLGITITIINYTLTFLICLSIYSFVKVNNSILKIKYLTQIVPCVSVLYYYSLNGQGLRNESDKMYQAIAEITWIDKPLWFKKCLLFMLTRAQAKLEVKPFGLYVVDLRNFAVAMNAAYSYFNVFNRLS